MRHHSHRNLAIKTHDNWWLSALMQSYLMMKWHYWIPSLAHHCTLLLLLHCQPAVALLRHWENYCGWKKKERNYTLSSIIMLYEWFSKDEQRGLDHSFVRSLLSFSYRMKFIWWWAWTFRWYDERSMYLCAGWEETGCLSLNIKLCQNRRCN